MAPLLVRRTDRTDSRFAGTHLSYPRPVTATVARRLATPSSVNAAIKQIADVMRRANYAGALQYVPELSWILFLRILGEREELEAEEAEALGVGFSPSLEAPFRWRDWAAPEGSKRRAPSEGAMGAFLPSRADSERSWTLSRDEIEARNFDLKAVNPNAKSTEDTRTPEELLDIIEAKGREVDAAIAHLRALLSRSTSDTPDVR